MTNSVSSPYTIDAFFAGVGGIELGFTQTGEFRVVYANEFDKNARKTYAENQYKANKKSFHIGSVCFIMRKRSKNIHPIKRLTFRVHIKA